MTKRQITKRSTWEVIGHIAVDTGMIWISDPCRVFATRYFGGPCESQPFVTDWSEFLKKIGFGRQAQIESARRVAEVADARAAGKPIPEPTGGHAAVQLQEVTAFQCPKRESIEQIRIRF